MCGREAWWSHLVTTGKGLHHPIVLALKSSTITEAFAMGVCSSTEQGIIKPENEFNSDELKKEHLEDKVVGEKPDSNIAAISDGYMYKIIHVLLSLERSSLRS